MKVGNLLLGLRVSTPALADAARSVFAPSLVDGVAAPPNVSIAQTNPGAGRPVYHCYRSGALLARTRAPRGALRAAVDLLSSYRCEPIPARLAAFAAVRDGAAVLLCPDAFGVPGLVHRLHRHGWELGHGPWARLDPVTAELVVDPPAVAFDDNAMEALDGHPADGAPPRPGKYRVAGWVSVDPEGPPDTLASRVAAVVAGSPDLVHDPASVVAAAAEMLRRAEWRPVRVLDAPSLVRAVTA